MARGTEDEVWRINFASRETWKRAIFMLFFLAVISMTEFVIYSLVILQFITVLISGKPNERLTEFGRELSVFVYNIFSFLTYNSEQRPFPFNAWPGDLPRRPAKRKRPRTKAAK
jgi:hypothetical protein